MKLPWIASVAALALAGSLTASANSKNGQLDVYWVDVEGGAATLIVTPADESVLIDSGNPGGRDSKRIAQVAHEKAGLSKIDFYITTHFHVDHFGGAAELSTLIPIRNVYDNGIPEQDPDGGKGDNFKRMIEPYRNFKAETRNQVKVGESLPLKSSAKGLSSSLRFLAARTEVIQPPANVRMAANADCSNGKEKSPDTSDNRNSVVSLIQFGGFRLYIGGDLTWNTESKLVCPFNLVGNVDVYQVTHHGLDISNNPLVVRALAPTVSIMSNGTRKGTGAETIATLKSVQSIQASYQIHKNLRDDKESNTSDAFIANLEEKCAANHIELHVAKDAKEYTVSIPANQTSRTFKTK